MPFFLHFILWVLKNDNTLQALRDIKSRKSEKTHTYAIFLSKKPTGRALFFIQRDPAPSTYSANQKRR